MSIQIAPKAKNDVKGMKLGATIYRACKSCGLPNPDPVSGQLWDKTCPDCGTKAVVEPQGVVAYWHRNPFKRFAFFVKTKLFHMKEKMT